MKETQRTIPIETYTFCTGCPYEMLNLHTQRLYTDNQECERIHTAKCRSSEVCLSLYERIVSKYEQENEWNEDEDTLQDCMMDDSDYSFCDDVSWEDRQI